jgi:hypothetical protein
MPVVGSSCWMVNGSFGDGRRFWLCFTAADINAAKTVSLAEPGSSPTVLESFLIDEETSLAPAGLPSGAAAQWPEMAGAQL